MLDHPCPEGFVCQLIVIQRELQNLLGLRNPEVIQNMTGSKVHKIKINNLLAYYHALMSCTDHVIGQPGA